LSVCVGDVVKTGLGIDRLIKSCNTHR